jgi:plastocyanin
LRWNSLPSWNKVSRRRNWESDYMRVRSIFAIVVALMVLSIGPADGIARQQRPGTPAASSSIVLVEIEDYAFAPARITIVVGDTVRWKNLDTSPHSVISDEDEEQVDSGRMDKGAGFRHQFDTPGTFNYECGYHQNMGGVIVVPPAGTPASEATPAHS